MWFPHREDLSFFFGGQKNSPKKVEKQGTDAKHAPNHLSYIPTDVFRWRSVCLAMTSALQAEGLGPILFFLHKNNKHKNTNKQKQTQK